ncbi:MAG: alpha-galactosidase [Chitinophagaceae bacterium]|nr:MAG: alpha-galactosidase [Chitinophagaceae bacterium]
MRSFPALIRSFASAVLLYILFPSNLHAQPAPVLQKDPSVLLDRYNSTNEQLTNTDWLINNNGFRARIAYDDIQKTIVLTNGLSKRAFFIGENLACTDYKNMVSGEQLLRSVKPECRVTIDNKVYDIGGLSGQPENGYFLHKWLPAMKNTNRDFEFEGFKTDSITPFVKTKLNNWHGRLPGSKGRMISFAFAGKSSAVKGISINIHYEIYDGLPLIVKWISLENQSGQPVKLDRVVNEIIGTVEEESAVVGTEAQMKKPHGIYIETNYAFNNAMRYELSDQTTHWKKDSLYTSQVNYDYKTPCLLEVYPENAPGIVIGATENYSSVRTFELLIDSYDRERRALMIRKMYRVVAPWVSQNPIFMHLVSKNDEEVKEAIMQCAATGYEALIMSFGSHCLMEDTSSANIAKWKSIAELAHKQGIKIGSYSLFSSRKISDEDDVISPLTGKPGGAFFGNAPCFGSNWGIAYRNKIKYFYQQTGFDIWENDGPYPGDICASVKHPGHKDKDDSQWKQMEMQKELYRWCNENGIYVNAPDWYFLDGTHKIALGYREVNFSLSRDQQKILNRQNIFDGTWEKTPSMGWGFVPLTKYQGGDADAILEPLSEHLGDYEQLMMQYYGAGVQACYRGPRLYDTESTKAVVVKVISWYKKYREILNADLIHLRRADGRDWDGWLHVDPLLKQKGLMMVYNPLPQPITRKIKLPLYYTGLKSVARIREGEGVSKSYTLNRDYSVELSITIPAGGYKWFVIE